jgi:hypothetical protein
MFSFITKEKEAKNIPLDRLEQVLNKRGKITYCLL